MGIDSIKRIASNTPLHPRDIFGLCLIDRFDASAGRISDLNINEVVMSCNDSTQPIK